MMPPRTLRHTRLTKIGINVVADSIGEHLSGRQIASLVVKSDPSACPNNQTIWNEKAAINKRALGGKRLIDVLFQNLIKSEWVYDAKFSEDNRLDALFLASPKSVELARRFHHLAIMDSTYKTNMYEWPMFQVVGFTSAQKTFTVAMAFLARENNRYYSWAIECLTEHVWINNDVP